MAHQQLLTLPRPRTRRIRDPSETTQQRATTNLATIPNRHALVHNLSAKSTSDILLGLAFNFNLFK